MKKHAIYKNKRGVMEKIKIKIIIKMGTRRTAKNRRGAFCVTGGMRTIPQGS